MLIFLWILISIIVFSIIILVHEFWHFKSARFFWVKVEEFWLWIPPKAKKLWTDKTWTDYTLNYLPIWGFVRLKWENSNINQKDSFSKKPYYQQAVIILSWVWANFLFAIFIFSILFFIWISPIWINDKIQLNQDLKIIPSLENAIEIWLIQKNWYINRDFKYEFWFFESIKYWTLETYGQTILTFKWIWMLAQKIFSPETPQERQDAIDQVAWPIWIVDFMTKSIWNWIIFIMIIWAIISINLWVFNLLPIPALDWWRFIFIVINWFIKSIFWKKIISTNIEWLVHVWFFIFLIALSVIIAYNDVNKIINN